MQTQSIVITVNGQTVTVPAESTVADLLKHLQIQSRAIAVELNLEIQASDRFSQQNLRSGDILEIVTLAGGG